MTGCAAALAAAHGWGRQIVGLTCGRVQLDAAAVLDRSDALALTSPGTVSPNGSCRLLAGRNGWIAVNLARAEDADLIPAWTGCAFGDPVWPAIAQAALTQPTAEFIAFGATLGLPVARLGEASPARPSLLPLGSPRPSSSGKALHVLDLSSLWAGPLCAAVLEQAGHEVSKVESSTRPDPLPFSAPAHDVRLNGAKRRQTVAFTRATLEPLMMAADIIVTSARPRAFEALGLMPERLFAANPRLIWVAITGHGWTGKDALRIGFGDDAAVAGGLVVYAESGPRFAGDALADPLTGLAAAAAALEAIELGGGVMIDAALSRTAALAAVSA